jgi:site-specific DNA-methyltransferase (adenine-specific)
MTPAPIQKNTLFYGDNLQILREYLPDECVDLIYLDPPFNSNRSYNVLFKDESGQEADAQITAFDDAWHWGAAAERTLQDLTVNAPMHVAVMIDALRQFIGKNQMLAYLVMMAARLTELHRVLKPTGSLYLHCDPTASHYLKIILDTIFGFENFQNEITWKRTSSHNDSQKFGRIHDIIFFYSKTSNFVFNTIKQPLNPDYVDKVYNRVDENGRRYRLDNISAPGGRGPVYEWGGKTQAWRYTKEKMEKLFSEGRIKKYPDGRAMINAYVRYLDESDGQPVQDWWDDIGVIAAPAKERLGYPTQKPLALLERILQASSNPGDVVLDPFSGCGTAIAAAQSLGRRWIGIDITHLAIAMHKSRLKDMFRLEAGKDYEVIGEPQDLADARQLARENRYQFQWWALSLVQARPLGGGEGSKSGKKGSDQGIDGLIPFVDDASGKLKRVLVQVKSGHVKSGDIRDLAGVLSREKDAPLGLFITLEPPSSEMVREAASAGFYTSDLWQKDYARLQILTIEQLFDGATVQMPPAYAAFKQAQRVKKDDAVQGELEL